VRVSSRVRNIVAANTLAALLVSGVALDLAHGSAIGGADDALWAGGPAGMDEKPRRDDVS
jgi:hypothetical protein